MIGGRHIHRIARITLECRSALSVTSGGSDELYDSQLLLDHNGLPAISGEAIAGVLQSVLRQRGMEAKVNDLFGFQDRDEGGSSLVEVSWAHLHDQHGRVVEGRADFDKLKKDAILGPVLRSVHEPNTRERVRLNHRGVTDGRGKFDGAVLPAGHRFGLELRVWDKGEDAEVENWTAVLASLAHPFFRLGGGTRNGLGTFSVVQVKEGVFDLSTDKGWEALAKASRRIGHHELLPNDRTEDVKGTTFGDVVSVTGKLSAGSYFRFGGGSEQLGADEAPPENMPKVEQRVVWQDGKGSIGGKELLIPGSSIKGALAHRLAFHANRHQGIWAEGLGKDKLNTYDKSMDQLLVKALFGFAKDDDKHGSGDEGRAGALFPADVYLSFTQENIVRQQHTSIDRFAGGVREHLLFDEELVADLSIPFELVIDHTRLQLQNKKDLNDLKKALNDTLADLCEGRQALGAAGGGHGAFKGELTWSKNGEQWRTAEQI